MTIMRRFAARTSRIAWSALARRLAWALGLLLCLTPARALAQAGSPLSIAFSGAPDPVTAGGTVVYRIALANPTGTPTGPFTAHATIPQYESIVQIPGGNCGATCRY